MLHLVLILVLHTCSIPTNEATLAHFGDKSEHLKDSNIQKQLIIA